MLAFRHQLNLTVLLAVGITVTGLLLLAHYQLNQRVFSVVTNELHQYVAILSQHTEQQRKNLLYDTQQLAKQAEASDWFILNASPLKKLNSRSAGIQQTPTIFAVVREDGTVTRANENLATHPLLLELPNWQHFQSALQTQQSQSGWLRVEHEIYYIVSQPVPGKAPARGAVVAAVKLSWPQLDVLKNIGMVIFDSQGKILSNQPLSWDLPQFKEEFESLFRQVQQQNNHSASRQGLTDADYAYVLVTKPTYDLPSFMLLQPLHEQIDFIHNFFWPSLAILIAVIVLWFFMGSVLQKQLRQVLDAMMMTVEHIERENYGHRLQLPVREEFNTICEAFNEMLESLEERERVHGVMAQMTSYEVASKLLNGTLRSDGELRRCTVLVADIPGFSALTRKLTAPVAMQVLNDYLTRMSFCIEANGGWVDKYMGDTIIALFGLEKHDAEAAFAAVQTAQDMLDAMTLFNLEVAAPRGLSMRLHITLATGKLVTGTVGASHHANYSSFGETINYAFQLRRYVESASSQILCDTRTHKLFTEAAGIATQQIIDTQPMEKDNVILGYAIIPRSRTSHYVLPEQARA